MSPVAKLLLLLLAVALTLAIVVSCELAKIAQAHARGATMYCTHQGVDHHANLPVWTDDDPFDPNATWYLWREQ